MPECDTIAKFKKTDGVLQLSVQELADKADECEQRWEKIAKKEAEKALAHMNEECVDTAEKMQNYGSTMIQNSEQKFNEMMEKRNVENLVKFKAQNEQHKQSIEKHLQQATADRKKIQELENKVKDLKLNKSRT